MSEQTLVKPVDAGAIEQVMMGGDLGRLDAAGRMNYYKAVCNSLGLNPLTRPFDYITLQGKLTLYAKRDAADQLRKINGVSVAITNREKTDGLYIVQAHATSKDGRTDESIGVVNIEGLKAEALANALMKAETKAKRRVTLSICGLGFLDETEVETLPGGSIPEAKPVQDAPLPEGDKPDPFFADPMLAAVYLENDANRKAFWKWTKDGLGLSEDVAHKKAGCESFKDFKGTIGELRTLLAK